MKKLTYYLPLVGPKTTAVFLMYNEDTFKAVARGVAFCSDKDQFNKKRGRSIAAGRACKAFMNAETCPNNKIRRKTVPAIDFTNKCTYLPTLTEFEKTLIAKINNLD
mgnify:CR=1 FL=1|jgi:hypothetical protein